MLPSSLAAADGGPGADGGRDASGGPSSSGGRARIPVTGRGGHGKTRGKRQGKRLVRQVPEQEPQQPWAWEEEQEEQVPPAEEEIVQMVRELRAASQGTCPLAPSLLPRQSNVLTMRC